MCGVFIYLIRVLSPDYQSSNLVFVGPQTKLLKFYSKYKCYILRQSGMKIVRITKLSE